MAKKQKNFRLGNETLEQLKEIQIMLLENNRILQSMYPDGIDETTVVIHAINNLYLDLKRQGESIQ